MSKNDPEENELPWQLPHLINKRPRNVTQITQTTAPLAIVVTAQVVGNALYLEKVDLQVVELKAMHGL